MTLRGHTVYAHLEVGRLAASLCQRCSWVVQVQDVGVGQHLVRPPVQCVWVLLALFGMEPKGCNPFWGFANVSDARGHDALCVPVLLAEPKHVDYLVVKLLCLGVSRCGWEQ